MSTKLYITRLSFGTTDHALKTLFEQHGSVMSAHVIIDRATSRSKGFGFVEMENNDEARAAIKTLDGKEFEGRTIAVSVARPQSSTPQITNYTKRKDNFRNGFQR
ncbi:MAG TPA: RNA-binding protein [Candidatus Saccharimonadales bacterium]|nr:RNA-binding protein [Candidatus Saccharimonadales bacterium]